jgi:hypothetical protein
MFVNRLVVCFLSTLALGQLAAADPDDMSFRDLRLEVGLPPAGAKVTTSQPSSAGGNLDDITWDKRGRWSLQWVPNIHPITPEGEGFFMLEMTSLSLVSAPSSAGDQLKERALTLAAHIGLAWVIFEQTTVEISALGAVGTAWEAQLAKYGGAREFGARLGLTWAPGATSIGRPLLGVALLATMVHLENEASLGGQTYDVVIDSRGFIPTISVGWRF